MHLYQIPESLFDPVPPHTRQIEENAKVSDAFIASHVCVRLEQNVSCVSNVCSIQRIPGLLIKSYLTLLYLTRETKSVLQGFPGNADCTLLHKMASTFTHSAVQF